MSAEKHLEVITPAAREMVRREEDQRMFELGAMRTHDATAKWYRKIIASGEQPPSELPPLNELLRGVSEGESGDWDITPKALNLSLRAP